jgi:hypothetical protein
MRRKIKKRVNISKKGGSIMPDLFKDALTSDSFDDLEDGATNSVGDAGEGNKNEAADKKVGGDAGADENSDIKKKEDKTQQDENPDKDKKKEEEVDETGVPWKNRAKEYERKYRELLEEQLKAKILDNKPQIANAQNKINEVVKKLQDAGYDEDSIVAIRELIKSEVMDIVRPISQTASIAARDKIIEKIKKEDDINAFDTIGDEIMAEIDALPPEYQANEEIIRTAVARAVYKNRVKLMKELASKSAGNSSANQKPVTPPVESSRGNAPLKKAAEAIGDGEVDEDLVQEYISLGIDPKRARVLAAREKKIAKK